MRPMVKSSNTLQGRLHMRPFFSQGSSTRSLVSTETKDDLGVAKATTKAERQNPRRVRFADEVRETASEDALTNEEKKQYYYNEDDLDRFNRDRALTALVYTRRKQTGTSWDDDKDSIRGLEEMCYREKKQDIRRRHAMAVLTTQKQEILAGRSPDPETLGEVAMKASKECRHRAVALGKEDSAAAGTRHRSFRNYRNSPNTSPIVKAAKKVKKQLSLWSNLTHHDPKPRSSEKR